MSPLYNQSKILIICFDVSFTPKRHKYGIKDSSRMIKKHTKSCRWTCIRKTPIRTLKWTFIYEIHTNGITVLGDERSSDFIRAHSEWPGMSKWDPPPHVLGYVPSDFFFWRKHKLFLPLYAYRMINLTLYPPMSTPMDIGRTVAKK